MTGTDTGVGKTWVSQGLMALLAQSGERVLGMKPVASGCVMTGQGLRSDDALMLQRQATETVDYGTVNPYAFEPAIAPQEAAFRAGVKIDPKRIMECFCELTAATDWLVVEGVGGWRVPLNNDYDVAAMAKQTGLPVLLVIGIRLGCINHALLTAESIQRAGLPLCGWVANCTRSADMNSASLSVLDQMLPAPCLGVVPPLASAELVAGYLSLPGM